MRLQWNKRKSVVQKNASRNEPNVEIHWSTSTGVVATWMTTFYLFCSLDRKNIRCESWKSQHECCNPQAVINSSSRLENR